MRSYSLFINILKLKDTYELFIKDLLNPNFVKISFKKCKLFKNLFNANFNQKKEKKLSEKRKAVQPKFKFSISFILIGK